MSQVPGQDATALFIFEHSLIPGIFQTPGYARAVLETHPNITEEEVSERVALRLARQAIRSPGRGRYCVTARSRCEEARSALRLEGRQFPSSGALREPR